MASAPPPRALVCRHTPLLEIGVYRCSPVEYQGESITEVKEEHTEDKRGHPQTTQKEVCFVESVDVREPADDAGPGRRKEQKRSPNQPHPAPLDVFRKN